MIEEDVKAQDCLKAEAETFPAETPPFTVTSGSAQEATAIAMTSGWVPFVGEGEAEVEVWLKAGAEPHPAQAPLVPWTGGTLKAIAELVTPAVTVTAGIAQEVTVVAVPSG